MSQLVSLDDYEKEAIKKLPKMISDFYRSGAGDEYSMQLNIRSYQKLRLIPRVMVDVSKRDMKTNIFGMDLSMPIAIAPSALHKMADPEGETATAKAAGTLGTVYTLSTASTCSIEDVAKAAPDTNKWFQLSIYKDRKVSEGVIRRVEAAGFKAIVVTLDEKVVGVRRTNARNNFSIPTHLEFANFKFKLRPGQFAADYVHNFYETNLKWNDIAWLKRITNLPIIVKGILNVPDAILAVENGVSGIIVSNHGGRQLDTTPAPIEVLPGIVAAVGHRTVVMMDGGIRQGTDVIKALALGAKLVLLGRPVIWGLAVGGQKGVESVLSILKMELDVAMTLTGCPTLNDIKRDLLIHESALCKL